MIPSGILWPLIDRQLIEDAHAEALRQFADYLSLSSHP